mgnify:CR=1 FL=1
MNTLSAERLYALLPAIHRIRDEAQGGPLRALLALIAQELEAIEENVEQLYDDQFIETCAEWVAPYIGDLIGYRPLHGVVPRVASPRAEVANTIAYRRRKGTAAMLEQLARDVTGWPAHAVEFFERLATTQHMNHPRLHAPATAPVRSAARMARAHGPFDSVAHLPEMRSPERGAGRYAIPNVGLFLWRLTPFSSSDVPLTPDASDPSGRRLRFDPLGADRPLFRQPRPEPEITHLAEPADVPEPIPLREMAAAFRVAAGLGVGAGTELDYGPGRSLWLSRPNADPALPPVPIARADVCICDLRDAAGGWAGEATLDPGKIAIDPRLGRVLLGAAADASAPILGTHRYGFSIAIGGGEYARVPQGADLQVQRVARGGEPLQPHLDAVRAGGRVVVADGRRYAESPTIAVDGETAVGVGGRTVVLASDDGARPVMFATAPIVLDIGARGRLLIDGLTIAGAELRLASFADDEPRELVLRDCTLVPGRALNGDGSAVAPGAPSLVVEHPFARVTLERCIVGALRVHEDAELSIVESIVDAGAQDAVALEGIGADRPGATLTVSESTVVGKLRTRTMASASNTLFVAGLGQADAWPSPVRADRTQEGCVRFCYVPAGAVLPRRFTCVPDDAHPHARPQFASLRYGDAAYAQLRRATDAAIREGADDGGEIGAMHPLHAPQREANLRLRLAEYLRFGLRAGIFHAT